MTIPADPPAVARHQTTYETPSERELVITRTFDAPRARVWAAFTDPAHLPRWQTGPDGFTMPVCEIDLRPGGAWRYVWRTAHGREFAVTGTYREVDAPSRVVAVIEHDGVEQQVNTTTFADAGGRTTVTVTMVFASAAARDQGLPYAKVGTDPNYARLDAYLAGVA